MDRLRATEGPQPLLLAGQSSILSLVAQEMMEEAGVRLLLSGYASDPIMEGDSVKGLFVECTGGRSAVRAKVTIDGTGNAEIAQRAGAPMILYHPQHPSNEPYIRPRENTPEFPTFYNDTGLFCIVGGVDWARYQAFCQQEITLTEEDSQWAEDPQLQVPSRTGCPKPLIPALRKAWLANEYRPLGEIMPGVPYWAPTGFWRGMTDGVVQFSTSCLGGFNSLDGVQMSSIEAKLRHLAFQAVEFHRRNAPGWERAFFVMCPFLGARGGAHIDAEHTLTPKECFLPTRFDDVLYCNTHEQDHGGDPSGFDVPYRATLPKGVDGILVCGRGAGYLRRGHDPSGMRARPSMMVLGQCVGTAAAIAALDGVSAKNVDIKKVQRQLVADGIVLGDEARLTELGLVG